jgi:hypothetical protein
MLRLTSTLWLEGSFTFGAQEHRLVPIELVLCCTVLVLIELVPVVCSPSFARDIF